MRSRSHRGEEGGDLGRTGLASMFFGHAHTSVTQGKNRARRVPGAGPARLFRLIVVPPGPDISLPSAVSLTGWSECDVRERLRELVGANLMTGPVTGRFTCHDLLRVLATASTCSTAKARGTTSRTPATGSVRPAKAWASTRRRGTTGSKRCATSSSTSVLRRTRCGRNWLPWTQDCDLLKRHERCWWPPRKLCHQHR